MDDPNEEFLFYLEAINSKLHGYKTFSKVVATPETVKAPSASCQPEMVSENNVCCTIVGYLYEQSKMQFEDRIVSGNILNLKDFDVHKKKDPDGFNRVFERCLKMLIEEKLLLETSQPDVFTNNKRQLFERLGSELHSRLQKMEDTPVLTFEDIFRCANSIVSGTNRRDLLSKELVYRILNDLYKNNRLYKADQTKELYGVI